MGRRRPSERRNGARARRHTAPRSRQRRRTPPRPVQRTRDWKGGGVSKHQQWRQPSEPVPGTDDDAQDREQDHPPPVVGAERAQSCRDSDRRREIRHAASAAELAAENAEQQPRQHRRSAMLPDEPADQRNGYDNNHKCSAEQVYRAPCARRLVRDTYRVHFTLRLPLESRPLSLAVRRHFTRVGQR